MHYTTSSILHRRGNKSRLCKQILPYLPTHNIYIEPFFGAGGLYFNKPKAQYNFLNDLDDDVYNLWTLIQNENTRVELYNYIKNTICATTLFDYGRHNKETDPIKKATRFLFVTNEGYYQFFQHSVMNNQKQIILDRLLDDYDLLDNVVITKYDFRDLFGKIHYPEQRPTNYENTFIYVDPPYLNTRAYSQPGTQKDTEDLFDILTSKNVKFAISEFDQPVIIDLAKKHKLNVIPLGDRRNLKNRKNEILITNYEQKVTIFDANNNDSQP